MIAVVTATASGGTVVLTISEETRHESLRLKDGGRLVQRIDAALKGAGVVRTDRFRPSFGALVAPAVRL